MFPMMSQLNQNWGRFNQGGGQGGFLGFLNSFRGQQQRPQQPYNPNVYDPARPYGGDPTPVPTPMPGPRWGTSGEWIGPRRPDTPGLGGSFYPQPAVNVGQVPSTGQTQAQLEAVGRADTGATMPIGATRDSATGQVTTQAGRDYAAQFEANRPAPPRGPRMGNFYDANGFAVDIYGRPVNSFGNIVAQGASGNANARENQARWNGATGPGVGQQYGNSFNVSGQRPQNVGLTNRSQYMPGTGWQVLSGPSNPPRPVAPPKRPMR